MFSLASARMIPRSSRILTRSFVALPARRIAQPSNKQNPPSSKTSSKPPADPTAPAGPLSESSPSALPPDMETTGPDYSTRTVPEEGEKGAVQGEKGATEGGEVETEKNWGKGGEQPKRGEAAEKEKGSGGYDGLKSDVKGGNAGRE